MTHCPSNMLEQVKAPIPQESDENDDFSLQQNAINTHFQANPPGEAHGPQFGSSCNTVFSKLSYLRSCEIFLNTL